MNLEVSIAATAELCGVQLSKPAAMMLLQDLDRYPEQQILEALARCRRELKGRLTVQEILSRIDDGRPGAEEAWASLVWDEESTMVVTSETMEAAGIARSLWMNGDKFGARNAFKEAYTRLITEAREKNVPTDWQVSLGYDRSGREGPIRDALHKGRLSPKIAQRFLPASENIAPPVAAFIAEKLSGEITK